MKNGNTISEIQTGHRVTEEIVDCGSIDTDAIWDILDMQLEERGEGNIININEENGCDRKDEDVLEEVMWAKFIY